MNKNIVNDTLNLEEDTQKEKYLIFVLDNESYGISINNIIEIIGIQPITLVPELPDYIKGIINLRGKIIPVMDVRLRFKKEFREYNDRTCIIVIDIEGLGIGLIVDRVSEVLVIQEQDIVPPPNLNKITNRFIRGIGKTGKEVKLILDCDKLINDEDNTILTSVE
ncbi:MULTISPECIES: chemotaxis protein CheW [Clostridium]|jgi:purine-binding chemotaxis protein CheW|uniref:Chemotaxis protein CheW n=1 Tax=Clostridium saccharoperbutylacetonicum N1-4(HMT) TaxID=931276 RepID=M1N773_9CLOT|nr:MULTISPECIES: chemotaxis protein CheW [Clostridium]AGF59227.1 chemotaxis signal transduction protein [Clostridium saccharoperbutylacetonicum N1-4(HMT)]AQR97896.1 chemotaxis protein CheW [Clostridium saccharoperbutylacetonicum]NRT59986.1 purine-binding chemotaxis protein CheW [Clostridium saccharoperbutylacetonicum]NSB23298.1 purine-binding chemotaxis protein CheW [Clostridium saccharoperbutylacetonicum]NSB33788.1 purine-binding chemotaxis protein CheW [Clostridium saccharoperbutylacetonicum